VSETAIANLALGRLGVGQAIASIDDLITPAKVCKRFYDTCRREVLRAFPWPFAYQAVALGLVSGQTFPGWSYVYAKPANCLTVRAIGDSSGLRFARSFNWCWDQSQWPAALRQPFQIALKDDGASSIIVTDVQSAYAFLTADVTNAGVFTPDFDSILAWRLAMEAGGPLTVKADLVERAKQEYLYWKSHATASALNESQDDERPESPSISVRY
jgi:hypothetical protein